MRDASPTARPASASRGRLRPRSLRGRLTLVFGLGSAAVVAAGSLLLYNEQTDSADRSVNRDLRSRSQFIARSLRATNSLILPRREIYAQVLIDDWRVATYTEDLIEPNELILTAPEIAAVENNGPQFFDRDIVALGGRSRLFAETQTILGRNLVIVVGSSLEREVEARGRLLVWLLAGGPVLLGLLSTGGWLLAGAALRPVHRMASEAAEISTADIRRRLSVPAGNDEIAHLGETLNDMLDRIEQGFARERQFVDDASHELRTPLAIMRAELELALGSVPTTETEQTLRSLQEEVHRLSRLADDLLVLARAGAGQLAPATGAASDSGSVACADVRVDLYAAAESVVRRLAHAAVPSTDPRTSPAAVIARPRITVVGDHVSAPFVRDRLDRVLTNLLTNAVRHATAEVEVRVSQMPLRAVVTVNDDGPGFEPALVSRAFERFTVADAARTRGSTGESTGLGLAIVKALVEAEGGTVAAANGGRLGGALLTVLVPLSPTR